MHEVRAGVGLRRAARAGLLAVAFGAALAAAWPASPAPADEQRAASISPQELYARMAKGTAPLVVDVRTPAEYRAGHIPGARNIPHDAIAAHANQLHTPSGVALYCGIGPRARLGEAALLEAGVDNVLHLEGGFTAWQEAGLPVEKP